MPYCNHKTPSRMIQKNFCNLQKFELITTQMVALTQDLVQQLTITYNKNNNLDYFSSVVPHPGIFHSTYNNLLLASLISIQLLFSVSDPNCIICLALLHSLCYSCTVITRQWSPLPHNRHLQYQRKLPV